MIITPNPKRGQARRRAANFLRYVFGMRKANGESRDQQPNHYYGSPRTLFAAVGRLYGHQSRNAITTFNLCFEELLSTDILREITIEIDTVITAGLDVADILRVGAEHVKDLDDGSPSSDAHIGYINILLANGARWQPYFERSDRALFTALTEILNYRFDLSSPKDTSRERTAVFSPKAGDTPEAKTWKRSMAHRATLAYQAGEICSRNDAVDFLRSLDGIRKVTPFTNTIILDTGEWGTVEVRGSIARGTLGCGEPGQSLGRKSLGEYEDDLDRGLELRIARHKALQAKRGRGWALAWYPAVRQHLDRTEPLFIARSEAVERADSRPDEPESKDSPSAKSDKLTSTQVREATTPTVAIVATPPVSALTNPAPLKIRVPNKTEHPKTAKTSDVLPAKNPSCGFSFGWHDLDRIEGEVHRAVQNNVPLSKLVEDPFLQPFLQWHLGRLEVHRDLRQRIEAKAAELRRRQMQLEVENLWDRLRVLENLVQLARQLSMECEIEKGREMDR